MTKKLDHQTLVALREDARRLEQKAHSEEGYPPGTKISRPNAPSRMFNLRVSRDQYEALQAIAREKHLPISTMARAWLLDRLAVERQAS